jgi:hypothetical protein
MKQLFHSLVVVILFSAVVSVHAMSVIIPITPRNPHAVGLAFDITTTNLSDGTIKFRVVISEKERKFSSNPSTVLGIVKLTERSRSVAPVRKLSFEREGRSIVCVFSVEQSALDDPSLCFVFTNYVEQFVDGKLVSMPSADFAFARLQDFARHQP